MKNRDIFRMALRNIKNDKKGMIINGFLVTLSVLIMVLSSVFSKEMNRYMYEYGYNAPVNCILNYEALTEEERQEFIKQISEDKRIKEIYCGKFDLLRGAIENTKELYGKEERLEYFIYPYMDVFKQYSDYDRELGMYEIILPKYMNVDDMYYVKTEFDKFECIETTDLVGKTVTLYFPKIWDNDFYGTEKVYLCEGSFDFKVVGTIDNTKSGIDETDLFISKETMDDILSSKGNKLPSYGVYVSAGSYNDRKELAEDVSYLSPYTEIGSCIKDWEYMANNVEVIGKILFVMCFITVVLQMVKSMKKRMSEFAIMKAMGYEQRIINKMLAFELLITFLFGFLVFLVILKIGIKILDIVKYKMVTIAAAEFMSFNVEPAHYLQSAAIITSGILIAYILFIEQMKKSNILKSIKSE